MKKHLKHISVILIMTFFVQILFLSGIIFNGNHVFASVDVRVPNGQYNRTSPLQTDNTVEPKGDIHPHIQDFFKRHPRFLESLSEELGERLIIDDKQGKIPPKTHLLETEKLHEERLTLVKEEVMNKTAISMGDGTSENPYQVWTAADLNSVRYNLSAHYIQMEDIDLSVWGNWTPIGYHSDGSNESPFGGVYDGNNYKISNMIADNQYGGLFGVIAQIQDKQPEIRNINIENANVTNERGGILAYAIIDTSNEIFNCHVSGILKTETGGLFADFIWSNQTVFRCSARGKIESKTGKDLSVGGFCYVISSEIRECFVKDLIIEHFYGNTTLFQASGFVFYGDNIIDCYAIGKIINNNTPPDYSYSQVYGFIATANQIINCYVKVSIYVPKNGKYNYEYSGFGFNATTTSCYYDAEEGGTMSYWIPEVVYAPTIPASIVRGTDGLLYKCHTQQPTNDWNDWQNDYPILYQAQPIIGSRWQEFWELLVEDKAQTTAEMKNITTFAGWDFESVWGIKPHINNGYPFLKAFSETILQNPVTGLMASCEIAKTDPTKISDLSKISDPIDTSTGAQIIDYPILTINGAKPNDFFMHYNSLLLNEGPLGKAWSHPYEAKLEILPDEKINVLWSENRKNLFIKEIDNTYSSADDSVRFDTLTKKEDESFELIRQDKTTYLFDNTGKLTEIINPDKFSTVLTYDEFNRLKEIIEPISNKKLTLYYNANNLIEKITDLLNREVLFQYDSNKNLTVITESTGETFAYTYNNDGQIVSLLDSQGKLFFENTFDTFGRVISQKDGLENGPLTFFEYDELTEPGKVITTVTDRNNNQKVLIHDSSYRLIQAGDELNHAINFVYDTDGNIISETDEKGNITAYTYDERGNLLSITNALGKVTTMTYDDNDNLLTIKNSANDITTFTYDCNQRLINLQDALGNNTSYTYDQNGLLLTETSPKGAVTSYTYIEGLLHTQTNPAGDTLTYSYDVAGRLTSIADAAGTVSMNYNNGEQITHITDPLNNTIEYTYDNRGNKLTEKDPKGNITTYTYSNNDLLISMKNPLNQTIYYEYDGENSLKKITDAKGKETTFTYDSKGQMTGITDPLGHTVTTEYDQAGKVKRRKDAYGHTSRELFYDAVYNLTSEKDSSGYLYTYEYDQLNNLIKATDPLNRITQFNYDALGRMISAIDALNGTSEQQFDIDGNRNTLTDPNQNTLTFNYNTAGQLISVVSETGNMVQYQYTNRNLLEKTINGRGQETNYTYNAAGQLISRTDNTGTVTYTYDANGNILTITNSQGTISYEYDALDRLIKYTDVFGNIIHYVYDANSNLTSMIYPDNRMVNYTYDDANRLIEVTDWNQRTTSYTYNQNNQLLTITRPDGSVETRTYNTAGRLIALLDTKEDCTVINHYTFTYDVVGNIIEESNTVEPELPIPGEFIQMAYNEANRLATYNGETILYDEDNNMTWGPLNGGMTLFTYDSRNRLTEVGDTSYIYDANNNRIAVTEDQVTKRYVVNPNAALSQVLMEKDEQGNVTASYVYGLGLISREDAAGEISFYHYDLRGSTVALTDIDGKITDEYAYDSFGELIFKDGPTENPFLYNGRDGVMTENNGLYYMRARYYNPEIKRFINEDVLLGSIENGQSLNRFAYVQGNPLIYIDPSGNIAIPIVPSIPLPIPGIHGKTQYSSTKKKLTEMYNEVEKAVTTIKLSIAVSPAIMKELTQAVIKADAKGGKGCDAAKGESKPSLKPFKNNKTANKAAQKQGYDGAEKLKDDFVGKANRSKFNMKYDKDTKEIILEKIQDSSVQVRTGLFNK